MDVAERQQISRSITAVVEALLESLRAHDPYTYGHCKRVGRNAFLLANAAGLNPFEQRLAEYAGLLHDIGKIGIPAAILRKQSALSEAEEVIMRTHCQRSVSIVSPLSHIPFFRAALPGIRFHHERIDGLGYPYGRHSDDIPILARIVTVVDAVDAITTRRPYRDRGPMHRAHDELRMNAGTQFDTNLTKIFTDSQPQWKDDFQIAPPALWAEESLIAVPGRPNELDPAA